MEILMLQIPLQIKAIFICFMIISLIQVLGLLFLEHAVLQVHRETLYLFFYVGSGQQIGVMQTNFNLPQPLI
jgi:hypothetical protein